MFTGIVQAVGKIVSVKPFVVDAGKLPLADVRVGDSICVQGACLTVTRKRGSKLSFDVSQETLECTTGLDRPGPVNLEKALRLPDRLGGHLVSGHVDGVGLVVQVKGSVHTFRAPKAVAKYVAPKGSICIDGVSLTVNRVKGAEFEANLIPHTLKVTTLSRLRPGAEVNMEADLVARYVEGFSKSA
ncbi:MAG TPA: riboflavin synthase [Burkholderiales bacterium]|nr:riboflavin synthase [Burkholderiales bacterium]